MKKDTFSIYSRLLVINTAIYITADLKMLILVNILGLSIGFAIREIAKLSGSWENAND